jgi:hypothetical protein
MESTRQTVPLVSSLSPSTTGGSAFLQTSFGQCWRVYLVSDFSVGIEYPVQGSVEQLKKAFHQPNH